MSAVLHAATSVFTTQTPIAPNSNDGGVNYELGMKFRSTQSGNITAIRYWRSPNDTGTHTGRIWSAGGTLLTSVAFTGETASGWQQQALSVPLQVDANTTYVVSVNTNGYYPFTSGGLATSIVNGSLSTVVGANGVYGNVGAFPANSFNNSNYFRDVVFEPGAAIVKISGDNQTGTVGTALASPLVVQVNNASGVAQSGATVVFSLGASGGSLSTLTATTGTTGRASTNLTLGTTVGTTTVTASVVGGSSTSFTATATAPVGAATRLSISGSATSTSAQVPVSYTVRVLDAFGSTVTSPARSVALAVTGITGTVSPAATATTVNGVATFTVTPTSIGTGTIRATSGTLTAASTTLAVSPVARTVLTTQTPAAPNSSDGGINYELGMKFRATESGNITAIRYWRSLSDTGAHTGRIWAINGSGAGTLLTSVNFVNETASGWQQQALAAPLQIQANTTYVVSVNSNGFYAYTASGLATSVVNGSLSSVADGANGVFGAVGSFPTNSFSNGNYFRDVVFSSGPTPAIVSGNNQSGLIGSALANPLVVRVTDANGVAFSGTPVNFAVTSGSATVSPASTTTSSTGQATASVVVGATPGPIVVTATTSNNAAVSFNLTGATLVGAASKLTLVGSSASAPAGQPVTYTIRITDNAGQTVLNATNGLTLSATGVAGTFSRTMPMTPVNGEAQVTFTPSATGTATLTATSSPVLTSASTSLAVSTQLQTVFTTQVPVAPNTTDGGVNYELGMKFRSTKAGTIEALRYWRAPSDTGAHTGRIWSAAGVQLASVLFTNETASGWQQQALAAPLQINPDTTYIVSVNSNGFFPFSNGGLATSVVNGSLSSVADGANGLFGNPGLFPTSSFNSSNYFRDVVFKEEAVGAPAKLALAPVSSTITLGSPATYTVTIQDSAGRRVTTATNPITFVLAAGSLGSGAITPASPLTPVNGQATFTFTSTALGSATLVASSPNLTSASATAAIVSAARQTVFTTQTPVAPETTDGPTVNYELGMKFRAANGGKITAIRYWRSLGDTGTHTGRIWSDTGTQLASVAFTAETASGWQEQALPAPLLIQGNTTYVVSVNANVFFADTANGLAAAISNGDLSSMVGGNGVFGTPGAFPTSSFQDSNYFRDVVFERGPLLTKAGGDNQSGLVSTTLTTPLRVLATDSTGAAIPNVTVNFAVTSGSATVQPASATTGADGQASTFVTLGATAGQSTVTASVIGGGSVNFTATATVPVTSPTKLGLVAPTTTTTVGSAVTFTASIQDVNGQTVTTATNPVTLTVSGLVGSFNKSFPVTPVNGQITANFTPSAIGNGTITATAAGLTSASRALSVTTAAASNPISSENQQAGTSAWRITNAVGTTAPEIAGYASATSVNIGETLPMKVSVSTPSNYTINVYRLGYYGGLGGRLMATSGTLVGATQTPCNESDPVTHLIECNWTTSYTLTVGTNWTSGLYVANLTRADNGKQSQIWFVVRNDSSNSDILFQSSFSTFLAYNSFGSSTFRSLYGFNSTNGTPALKVSFDRPFGQVTTDPGRYDNMLKHERNMMMWLESQGYNVSYNTNMDTHAAPARLLTHRVFLSVGHDEYWSLEMRNGVEAARDAGVNLGFFSANTAYWRVRFEPSSTGVPNRVMVCYKNPLLNDPVAPTYLWRGPENNRPENALIGVMYTGDDSSNLYGGYGYVVSNSNDPYFASTTLTNGTALPLLVGFEWDSVVNNGFTPPGLTILSTSPVTPTTLAPNLPPGTNTNVSHSTKYTASSGAKVFATGSIQWMWALNDDSVINSRADNRARQMAVNILADMQARPATPTSGIIVP